MRNISNYGKIKLFISTFGKKVLLIRGGIPIEVGAACRNKFKYKLKDNTGDNISDDNSYWGELTGVYWIWKNYQFEENDIVGFCHYNKALAINRKSILKEFSCGEFETWIVRKGDTIVKHTYPNDVLILENILKQDFPAYYLSWKKLYDLEGKSKQMNNCYNAQMFYTSVEQFDEYCNFLFGVLFKLRDEIGDVKREIYHKRYLAFLGERLLSVYLDKKEITPIQVEVRNGITIEMMKSIARALKININSSFYLFMKGKFGRKSSYRIR